MGVKGLFSFLKKWEQPCSLENERIGIDLFYFLHRSKGDGHVLQELLAPYLSNEVHFVLDGTAFFARTQERQEELDERRERRKRVWTEVDALTDAMEQLEEMDQVHLKKQVQRLERQAWTPSKAYIKEVCEWVESQKASRYTIHQAEGEADEYLVQLEREGVLTLVVSNDSDLITGGVKRLMRPYDAVERQKMCIFDTDFIRVNLGFNERQWNDFLWMCKNMREQDVVLAYSLISVYKRLDSAVERWEEVNGGRLLR